jgi:hypothetical protein
VDADHSALRELNLRPAGIRAEAPGHALIAGRDQNQHGAEPLAAPVASVLDGAAELVQLLAE